MDHRVCTHELEQGTSAAQRACRKLCERKREVPGHLGLGGALRLVWADERHRDCWQVGSDVGRRGQTHSARQSIQGRVTCQGNRPSARFVGRADCRSCRGSGYPAAVEPSVTNVPTILLQWCRRRPWYGLTDGHCLVEERYKKLNRLHTDLKTTRTTASNSVLPRA